MLPTFEVLRLFDLVVVVVKWDFIVVFDVGYIRDDFRVKSEPASKLIVKSNRFAVVDGERTHRDVRWRQEFLGFPFPSESSTKEFGQCFGFRVEAFHFARTDQCLVFYLVC